MLRHGYVPEQWKDSVIVPILKNKTGSKIDPDDYRGITLSSVTSKFFERVLLIKYGHLLKTSQLQFGFTPNVGTATAYVNNAFTAFIVNYFFLHPH